jgi:hypothetical protein
LRINTLVILLLIVSIAVSETAISKIVINEVELNPPGNDYYNDVFEWVEIYNDGDKNVNIGGWKLSTTRESAALIIPLGTIIPEKGFYVVESGSMWLSNDDELVILETDNGIEIDRTPHLSDNKNDNEAWSRYPNGYDTDSDSDWSYMRISRGR